VAHPVATEPAETAPNGATPRPAGEVALGEGVGERWQLPLVVLIVGMFMSILDISIVTTALPPSRTSSERRPVTHSGWSPPTR
jgi:hypothetical protein